MSGGAFFRYSTLEDVIAIHDACQAAMLEGLGSVVVSTSGGGESETRIASVNFRQVITSAQREMHRRDPSTYPNIPNVLQPSFSNIAL